jgi:DNA-binding NtrC family response regulator
VAQVAAVSGREPIVVLFVDDEEAMLRSIVRVLGKTPLEVLTATGAEAALRVLAEQRVDVIVSDIDMPGVNGLDLLRRVRSERPEILRMMLTGAATVERALDAINGGEVVRFFTKPFDVDLFRASMEALIERIDRSRREHADATLRARRVELQRWLDRRYPGLLDIEKGNGGELVIDVGPLAVAIDATKLTAARRAFGEDD